MLKRRALGHASVLTWPCVLVATALSVLLALCLAVPARAGAARRGRCATVSGTTRQRPSASVARALRSGRSFVGNHIELCGDLDLADAVVGGVLECRACVIAGTLAADDAHFEEAVDLSGTHVLGRLSARAAQFDRPVSFNQLPRGRHSTVAGQADFELAEFASVATFRGADFAGAAHFDLARFADDAIFDGTDFAKNASFRAARFAKRAGFVGETTQFLRQADFDSASFAGSAAFSQADFEGPADFNNAVFFDGGQFVGTTFAKATFEYLRATSLDFTAVEPDLVDFSYGSAQSVNFRDAIFSPNGLELQHVAIADLDLAVADVRYVAGDRLAALQLIEQSAKNRGDLAVANDAHYQEDVMASNKDDAFVHILDVVFYRWVAGYLVRPLHPVVALLLLILAAGIFRSSLRRLRRPRGARSAGPLWRRAATGVGRTGNALFDTVQAILPGDKPLPSQEGWLFLVRFETFVYRVLAACILIGLANSNPTLRQVLSALHI